jgi:hypothetical protein
VDIEKQSKIRRERKRKKNEKEEKEVVEKFFFEWKPQLKG